MIHIDKEDMEILQNILKKYPYQFFAYGSRVNGTNKKISDLDICIMNQIDDLKIQDLREDITESNLQIRIDLTKWKYLNEDFRNSIKENLVNIK